jgi:hypothetical protein
MGKAYRLVMHELTLRDIMDIRADEKYRLTTSPFGVTPEQYERNPPIYVGAAVAWKMHPERMPPAVKAGLERAIKISKACAGILGTVIWNGKLYPKKCIEQKKQARKI